MSTVSDLITMGDRLFAKRGNLLEFWQEIALNFNPVAADFDSTSQLGEDYAADLTTSYPLIVARELTDVFSSMLRPSDREWAIMEVADMTDWEGKAWLEWATKAQRRAMYDRAAQFIPCVKDGDRDFGLFGQAVMTVEVMPDKSSMLYRPWHLRDTAWSDSLSGGVECVHRKWLSPTAYELAHLFGEKALHQKVRDQLAPGKDPHCTVACRHAVIPTSMYHGETKFRTPLVSIYIDVDNDHVMEVTGQRINPYVIPRWQRVKGTQYAVSPATVCALPEARLLQAMTWTLLEAGEKATNPPLIGVQEALRGDINVSAGSITWAKADYDERTGAALRPLSQDKSGMPLGLELQQRSEVMIRQAMYLHKLDLPQRGPEMTAYEVGQRVQEYIRNALPLFEPMEIDYNGALCERTFEVLATNGGFGPPESWPASVRGADVQFKFVSPLRDQIDKQKAQVFAEATQTVAQAIALDPSVGSVVDAAAALRDTLQGIGVPTKWTRSAKVVEQIQNAQAQALQQQQMLQSMQQAAGIAKDLRGTQMPAAVPA
jgi:hypothetical protein